ncbi:ArnT family glycosyltransferase [Sphingomonas sp. LT1P40]|uniref:ArnT family glycosyltransferase n=1 Tax=Alteristakelama amylovorans TaxID=3096166 RepID=UPI002FC60228
MSAAALPRWLILIGVALAARAITFGNPILHVDEELYFVAARAMLDGALPFVDIWDRKPVGLFLLYAPAAALGFPTGIWAYQVLALACLVATAMLAARLARRAGWERGALAAGVAVILWPNLIDGQGGQAPVFYNLLMIAAAALIAPRDDDAARPRRRFATGFAAMTLVGLALQVKYAAVFEGLFFGLWLLWREWRLGRSLPGILAVAVPLAGVALVPTLAGWAIYARMGHGDAWLYANFLSILDRNPDPWIEQIANLAAILLILSPLLAAAALAWRTRGAAPVAGFLFVWALASVVGLLIFGSYFDHYALPLIPPLAIAAAGFFGLHRRFALWTLVLVFLGGQVILFTKRTTRGTPGEVAAIAQVIGSGPGCLHVYSGSTMLYPMTGRCAVTRWIFPSHLSRIRERGAIGVEQEAEIDRILRARPEWVVMRKPYRGERPEIRAQMLAGVQRDYRQVTILPLGNERYALWRLATPPSRSASSSE